MRAFAEMSDHENSSLDKILKNNQFPPSTNTMDNKITPASSHLTIHSILQEMETTGFPVNPSDTIANLLAEICREENTEKKIEPPTTNKRSENHKSSNPPYITNHTTTEHEGYNTTADQNSTNYKNNNIEKIC